MCWPKATFSPKRFCVFRCASPAIGTVTRSLAKFGERIFRTATRASLFHVAIVSAFHLFRQGENKVANYDTYENIVTDCLFRMDEPTDGSSDFDAAVRRAVVRAFHDFTSRHPFWFLLKYPPGVFATVAPFTTITLTIATAGAGATCTLSAAPTPASLSIANFKIRPSGKDYILRVTAHTAGAATCTVDNAPETIAAGTASVIFQDEYALASDLGLFNDGLWTRNGDFVELWSEERLRREFPDPSSQSDSPIAFCRLTTTRIRLSHYPASAKRFEYPYAVKEADPSGSGDLTIAQNFRYLLSDGGLYFAYLLKSDKRAGEAKQDYERGIMEALAYDRRVKMGVGSTPSLSLPRGPYE